MYIIGFGLCLVFKNLKIRLSKFEIMSCFKSLPSSIYENKEITYSLRPISKLVFNILAFIGLGLITGPFWKKYPSPPVKTRSESSMDIPLKHLCRNICKLKTSDLEACTSFSQSDLIFHAVLISLWSLLAISTIEGIIEQCFKFMPHRKFLEPIEKSERKIVRKPEKSVQCDSSTPEKETMLDSI